MIVAWYTWYTEPVASARIAVTVFPSPRLTLLGSINGTRVG